ncbi:MAG: hypothetical protein QM681_06075 [Novosphingobium sp.]
MSRAPSDASRSAVARPIPVLAPATTTTLSASLPTMLDDPEIALLPFRRHFIEYREHPENSNVAYYILHHCQYQLALPYIIYAKHK